MLFRSKRVKEAEVLEEKLRRISEEVPTKIGNTSGSTAGAGSGGFHQYRQQKRRDQIRQGLLEADLKRERENAAFDERRGELAKIEEAKTAKRRAKRQKLKAKQRAKRKDGSGGTAGADPGPVDSGSGAASQGDAGATPNEDQAPKHVFNHRR